MDSQQTAAYNALRQKFNMIDPNVEYVFYLPKGSEIGYHDGCCICTDRENMIVLEATPNNFGHQHMDLKVKGVSTQIPIFIGLPKEGHMYGKLTIVGTVTINGKEVDYTISHF